MWTLYLTAKTTATRPSELVCIEDRWTALQFDNAITMIGVAIENAAQEMEKRGEGKTAKYEPKYTMTQLLDPAFRLPPKERSLDDFANDIRGIQGIKYDEVS